MEDNRLSDHGSDAIFTMGTNAHNWYGFITNYTNNFTEALNFTAGIDFRFYKGFHYDKISDLLGGEYYLDNKLAYQDPNQKLKVGDKVNQDYTSRIANTAGFVQLAYTKKTYKAFVSVSAADYRYQREDPGKYGGSTNEGLYPNSMIKTKWKAFVPVSVKGGFNYKIARIHNVFINGGWMSRAPMMDNIYADNVPIANPITEKIGTVELGYKLNISNFYFVLNGYYTRWMDKSVTKAIGSWNGPKACIPNIDAIHKGIELEASYRPHPSLLLAGAFSLGDWRWANDVSFTLFDEQQNKVGEYNAYIKDLHVGNAPQTSLAVSATWEPLKKLFIGAALNYYGRNYADFAPADRTNPDDRADSWKLPNFYTIDLNMNYKFTVGKLDAILYANVNNLLNKKYISDALDGTGHDQATAVVWYGFGTTWTTGVRVLF
ncbi:MAG: hypothetical protein PUB21_04940 [Bacteroidales bacterium]|nr:hypothetical protein [Bacteroidales bacterium]